MNIKKLFAVLAGVSFTAQTLLPVGVMGATYSQELQDAYDWAHSKGVTTMDTIDNANMYGAITRAEMAKMLSVYAKEVLGKTPDTSASCVFVDIDSVKGDLHEYIIESCQLGIMGQNVPGNKFRPYDTISRAEFGTALSRVLWGSKYEGGIPYYANHLNALKAAGIMNQIANAEQTKEVRGYVMLMLMRSEASEGGIDCKAPDTLLACLDPESDAYKDCPAACRDDAKDEDKDSDEVVKSGDLEVSAQAAADRKILINGTSDLDTLTFKSSEEVTLNKVILERYGYSTNNDVAQIWLENENGTVISNVYEGLDTKGQAKLTIKKDYRAIDGSYNATIVVKANGAAGKTMGFKVIDVDSTAKNLNVDKYNPYTYEMVAYSGASVTFTIRGTSKDYNWEDGKSYEINKFKVKAPSDSAITVKGFTLTMTGADKLDLRRYLEKAEVTVDGDTVSSTWEVNKDDQLVISFKKDVELAAKDNKEFVVSATFGDDFYNDYGKTLQLGVLETSDFNAVDSKTSSRVTVETNIKAASWPTYVFKGGKVKVTNTRLGNVDGAQAANDIVIGEGNITVPEDIKGTIQIKVTDKSAAGTAGTTGATYAIQAMRIIVAGDEYESNNAATSDYYKTATFTFNNVEVEKSGKIQVKVDIRDIPDFSGKKLNFSFVKSFNDTGNFVYVEGKKNIDVAGSMSLSDLTIQAAKGSLTNSLTKDVEFRKSESNRKTVFDGTYTAKKGGVKLNEFTVSGSGINTTPTKSITFYLSIDGDEVADAKWSAGKATSTFSNVEIDSEKSVKVVLEAEVDANDSTGTIGKFTLNLLGEDENGNTAGKASRSTPTLKVVEVGAIEVSTATSKKDILRKSSNALLAEFTVKPANGASEVDLETIEFALAGNKAAGGAYTVDDITLTIGGVTEDGTNPSAGKFSYSSTKTIGSDGIVVKVELNEEADGEVSLTNLKVNSKDQSSKQFVKAYYPAVVKVSKMEDLNGTTRYTVSVDKDSDIDVQNFTVYYSGTSFNGLSGDFANGDKFSIAGVKDVVSMITGVSYEYSNDAAGTCSDASITDKTTCQSTVASYETWTDMSSSELATGAVSISGTAYYTRVSDTSGTGVLNDGTYAYTFYNTGDGTWTGNVSYWSLTPGSCSDSTSVTQTACEATVASYETWTASGYSKVSISKDALPDYFKIGSNEEDLKIFKL